MAGRWLPETARGGEMLGERLDDLECRGAIALRGRFPGFAEQRQDDAAGSASARRR
jgi:hypothetical protein